MKITIVGTGYVGLVTGTCFAETGVDVICCDIDKKKIDNLKNGILPVYEPGLKRLVSKNMDNNQLSFSNSLKDSLPESDIVFIAVGTPSDEDGSADLKHVLAVASEIGKHMESYMLIATKSTVPVGTAEKVRASIQKELDSRKVKIAFDVASNPEFLKEGDAVEDFLRPDRIIVGVDSEKAKKKMDRLYKPFILNNHPIIYMDIPSAELTKYAANAMLATKISFMNDIANLCEIVGADINMVRKGIGSDPRIGNKFIYAGVGFGGSCFPKDIKALIKTGEDNGYSLRILNSVNEVNNDQKMVMVNKIMKHFNNQVKDKIFAVWGLSFKPNTDDMREAPSEVIINELVKMGARVKAFDPVAVEESKRIIGNKIEYASDRYEALIDAEALILVTEWNEFRMLNYKVMKKLMKGNVVFDGRNIYEPEEVNEFGFHYYGIGK